MNKVFIYICFQFFAIAGYGQESCDAFKKPIHIAAPHMFIETAYVPAIHNVAPYLNDSIYAFFRPGYYLGIGRSLNSFLSIGVSMRYYDNDLTEISKYGQFETPDDFISHIELGLFGRRKFDKYSPFELGAGLRGNFVDSESEGFFFHTLVMHISGRYTYHMNRMINVFIEPQLKANTGAIFDAVWSTITYNYSINIHLGILINLK